MLVLTRKKAESIMIGEEIEIVVTEISPGQVRIGVKAPHHLQVLRKEIYQAIREANIQAGTPLNKPDLINNALISLLEQENNAL